MIKVLHRPTMRMQLLSTFVWIFPPSFCPSLLGGDASAAALVCFLSCRLLRSSAIRFSTNSRSCECRRTQNVLRTIKQEVYTQMYYSCFKKQQQQTQLEHVKPLLLPTVTIMLQFNHTVVHICFFKCAPREKCMDAPILAHRAAYFPV